MRAVPKTIALRLVLALTVLVALSRVIFGYVETERYEKILHEQIVTGADELTRSITAATWHAMLADDRESAYRIMRSIAQERGIDQIRIVNKRGTVTFSTSGGTTVTLDIGDPLCSPCHRGTTTLAEPELARRTRIVTDPGVNRVLQMLTPIRNEPACSQAACHAHEPERNVLGVLAIDLDLRHTDRELAGIRRAAIWRTLLEIAVMALLIVVLTRWLVGLPIRRLTEGIHEVSEMHLDHPIEVEGHGELRALARTFNEMRERLRDALAELRELAEGLEQQVEERSQELGRAHERLIRSDRLASLGQLAASVAHEINNPISGVLNFSMVVQRMLEDPTKIEERLPEIRRYLDMMAHETERVGHIVSDLLAFSRRSSPSNDPVDVGGAVRQVMSLLEHRLQLGQNRTHIEIADDLPPITGDASQLQQVLVNLVMNAAEAMPEGGDLIVRVGYDDEELWIEVQDHGTGIDPVHRNRIFDPFFSTKDMGKGVGLGLSVVYGIVNAHGGRIDVESEPGRGTTFRIHLPRQRSGAAQPALASPSGEEVES